MSKYEIGDRLVVEITDIDEGGMGTAYVLNNKIFVTDADLDLCEILPPLSELREEPEKDPKTYTPDDLMIRIKQLSTILKETIDKYIELKYALQDGIPNLDDTIERLSL